MIRPTFLAGLTLCLIPAFAWAASPRVAVDIAPLHSIVTQVMDGVGHPDLLIRPESSPHRYSLRPSEAEALAEADVVFWISDELTPWLENSLNNLAGSASTVEMLKLSATMRHEYRESATFEAHEHADEGEHDEHHDDHKEHHDDHDEQHHGEYDPHAWLDPMNAKVWASEIAHVLSRADPSNAEVYRQNAQTLGGVSG